MVAFFQSSDCILLLNLRPQVSQVVLKWFQTDLSRYFCLRTVFIFTVLPAFSRAGYFGSSVEVNMEYPI